MYDSNKFIKNYAFKKLKILTLFVQASLPYKTTDTNKWLQLIYLKFVEI